MFEALGTLLLLMIIIPLARLTLKRWAFIAFGTILVLLLVLPIVANFLTRR
jgi:hypothetical protein